MLGLWNSVSMPTLNGADYSFEEFMISGYKYFKRMGYSEEDAKRLAELVDKPYISFSSVKRAAESSDCLVEAMSKIQNKYSRR